MKEKLFTYIFILLFFVRCSTNNEDEANFLKYDWEISTPSELNINTPQIEEAFSRASSLNYLYSIVIVRNGKIAAEKYFNGYDSGSFFNIRSVSKSFLSAIFGIAIDKGIISTGEKLIDLVDDYNDIVIDSRFHNITLGYLIKMKGGLDKDVNIYSYVFDSVNWLSTIFQMNLIEDPGSKFIYSTPGTHLLSAILTKVSGKSTLDFATENLFQKLGIEINHWEQDPQGIYFGGNNMHFTTRNMATLGLLYLNNGIWNNNQIIPPGWIQESLKDHTPGNSNWGVMKNIGYGYLWWLGEIQNYKIFTAIGHGGQFVLCVPELDLVVATNAHSNIWWEEANSQELEILNIIGNYIIPAVEPL